MCYVATNWARSEGACGPQGNDGSMPGDAANAEARPSASRGQLAPLRIESTSSLVAARIRTAIFDGTFRPDGQLNEIGLARSLGVSRASIREAFQRLIHEGLLRSERNRGVFMVALDAASTQDIYFVRAAIETAAALRLAESQDDAAIKRLEQIVGAIGRAADGEWSELVAIDLEFHCCLVAASGSPRLIRAFEPMYAETRMLLGQLEIHYEHRADLVDEHRAIIEAIRACDPELIERLVHQHMSDSAAKLAP
jgi:DNA-binding GntR family transcriptional regulator